MSQTQEIVCIVCPVGCRMKVTETETGRWLVEGNTCKRGQIYAKKEMTNPTRILPTTVKIKNGFLRRLPVKTNGAIPKGKLFEAMKIINTVEVEAPIKVGQVIIENILDTGIDVVASRSMKKL